MSVDPGEERVMLGPIGVSYAISEQVRGEYANTLGTLFGLIEQLHQELISEQEFQKLARSAQSALNVRIDDILAHSVGGRPHTPQRLSTDEQAFDPAPDQ